MTGGTTARTLTLLAAVFVGNETGAQVKSDSRGLIPVMIAGTDLSTCNTAVVTGLGRRGGISVSVRSGPSFSYARTGRIYQGQQIFVCNERHKWLGIVYGPTASCNLKTSGARAVHLPKGCRSGWANRRWIEITSG